ncbi:33281_t:CDS:10, partial [Racocetra persica]
RDKGEKIYGPVTNIVYWPKNRHCKSIKDIPDRGGSDKHSVRAQTWHSFFRWNGIGEWIPEHIGEKKFLRVVIWDEEVSTDYRAKCSKLQKWECLEKEWTPSDHGRKQNCLVEISGSFDKQELVKNDIVYLFLNTLSKKFLADILIEKKILDWDLGYTMTIHTSQGMTLEAPQRFWIIDEYLIEEAKNKKAIEQSLRLFISGKLLKDLQKDICASYWDDAGDLDQWIADRIDNKLGHIEGNMRLTCLKYMVKQDNDSVIDFYMKVKASTSDSEKQVREIFINGLSPENYLEAEKFESGILLNELEIEIIETGHRRGSESSTSSVVRRMEKHSIQSQDLLEIIEEDMSDVDDNEDGKGNRPTDQSIIPLEKESRKRPSKDTPENKLSSKKVKTKDRNVSILKKLIEGLKSPSSSTSSTTSQAESITSPSNFSDLYSTILKERLAEYMKDNKERRSQRKLYKEVEKQLSSNLSKNAIEKRIERARKIYNLFSSIEEEFE